MGKTPAIQFPPPGSVAPSAMGANPLIQAQAPPPLDQVKIPTLAELAGNGPAPAAAGPSAMAPTTQYAPPNYSGSTPGYANFPGVIGRRFNSVL